MYPKLNINNGHRPAKGTQSCQAPFKSLRLGPGNRISMCCHNQADILGHFPEQSLMETWNGTAVKDLRTLFGKGRMSPGCFYCIHEAEQQSNVRSAALYDRYTANMQQPVILDFKTENHCNLACVMCSGLSSDSICPSGTVKESPFHTKQLLDEIEKIAPGLMEVRFSGGEPFLSPFYEQIWMMLVRTNPQCRIQIQTNGTILNDRIKALLEKGNFHINISIDSFDDDTYASIRKGSKLSMVLSNLEWFRTYCSQRGHFFGITSCAMNENVREMPEMVRRWNQYGAFGWFSTVWFPPQYALWMLEPVRLRALQETFQQEVFAENDEVSVYNVGVFRQFIQTMEQMIAMAEKRHHVNEHELMTPEEFIREMIEIPGLVADQHDVLTEKIHNCFPASPSGRYHGKLFREITSFASPALIREIMEITDEQKLSAIFGAFNIQPEKA